MAGGALPGSPSAPIDASQPVLAAPSYSPPGASASTPSGVYGPPTIPQGYAQPMGYYASPPGYGSYQPPSARNNKRLFVIFGALALVVIVGSLGALGLILASNHSGGAAHVSTVAASATIDTQPTATPQIFFQDPLTSNVKGWSTDSDCVFKNDGLHITDEICYAPAGRLGNVDVKVAAQVVNGDLRAPFGIDVRDTSEGANRYDFDISSDGSWAIFLYTNQRLTRLVDYQPNASIHQGIGATNMLEVRVVGTHLQFFANGDRLGQTDDSALIDGYIGLLSGKGTETVFSNLALGVP